jgi:hypothetical protein
MVAQIPFLERSPQSFSRSFAALFEAGFMSANEHMGAYFLELWQSILRGNCFLKLGRASFPLQLVSGLRLHHEKNSRATTPAQRLSPDSQLVLKDWGKF